MNSGRWGVGDPIILREVYQGRVWAIRPVTVVEDSADRIALFMAPGTIWKRPVSASGEPLRIQTPEWELADLPWAGNAALRLNTPGAAHSVIVWWEPASWRLEGWYVNLEQPFRRTTLGFDYLDQVLDIVVAPDRSSWFWKDEDEFAAAQELGVLTREEAAAVRREGERVIAAIEANASPFCDGWEDWRPDPAWIVAGIPEGWDDVGRATDTVPQLSPASQSSTARGDRSRTTRR